MARILVVDDEFEVRDILKKFLTAKGYEVDTAIDGETTIKKVKEFNPNVVLLDIMMPGMGGIETLKEIKKIDPSIGVIMVTAAIDEDLAKRALEIGAFEYITKPINLHYLENVVLVKMADFWD